MRSRDDWKPALAGRPTLRCGLGDGQLVLEGSEIVRVDTVLGPPVLFLSDVVASQPAGPNPRQDLIGSDPQAGATPFAARCIKDRLEEMLFAQTRDLFTSLELVFFDTT